MRSAAAMNLPATIVHIIDRESDSVFHFRQWSSEGFYFLVRADERRVQWRGQEVKSDKIAEQLEAENAFYQSRKVLIKGKPMPSADGSLQTADGRIS